MTGFPHVAQRSRAVALGDPDLGDSSTGHSAVSVVLMRGAVLSSGGRGDGPERLAA